MFASLLLLCAIGLFTYSFHKWATRNNDFFKKRGILYLQPTFLLGNTGEFFFKKITLGELAQKLYTSMPSERVIGFFGMLTPMYLIRDPELFKQISIKDFDSFQNLRFFIDPEVDSLFGNTILCMREKKWHDMRVTLSPAFTGNKMRQMFELVRHCALNTSNHFQDSLKNKTVVSVEMTDIFSRFSTDVVTSCSFGYDVNSFKDRTNEFYENGKKINGSSVISAIKFIVQNFAPQIMKILRIEYFCADLREFITRMVLDNMKSRRMHGINRPDMIDLLMKAQKGTLVYQEDDQPVTDGFATVTESHIGMGKVNHNWSDAELISLCFLFFLGGYDTMTAAFIATVYELTINQNVQQKLFDEIAEMERNLNGELISYEGLQRMKYMDMVVSEVLRIRPPASFIDRICSQDYELQIDERKIKIRKGTLWIPIHGYHHDPKYFPNPQQFDPERFNDENKGNINMAAYISFGSGPRNCIASRFALMQMKIQIYYLLRDFSMAVNSKTEIPMKIKSTLIGAYPKNGLHLNVKIR